MPSEQTRRRWFNAAQWGGRAEPSCRQTGWSTEVNTPGLAVPLMSVSDFSNFYHHWTECMLGNLWRVWNVIQNFNYFYQSNYFKDIYINGRKYNEMQTWIVEVGGYFIFNPSPVLCIFLKEYCLLLSKAFFKDVFSGTDIQMSLCQGFGEIPMNTILIIWFSFCVLLSSLHCHYIFTEQNGSQMTYII